MQFNRQRPATYPVTTLWLAIIESLIFVTDMSRSNILSLVTR